MSQVISSTKAEGLSPRPGTPLGVPGITIGGRGGGFSNGGVYFADAGRNESMRMEHVAHVMPILGARQMLPAESYSNILL
jgi:hypothetical protein